MRVYACAARANVHSCTSLSLTLTRAASRQFFYTIFPHCHVLISVASSLRHPFLSIKFNYKAYVMYLISCVEDNSICVVDASDILADEESCRVGDLVKFRHQKKTYSGRILTITGKFLHDTSVLYTIRNFRAFLPLQNRTKKVLCTHNLKSLEFSFCGIFALYV